MKALVIIYLLLIMLKSLIQNVKIRIKMAFYYVLLAIINNLYLFSLNIFILF